MNPQPEARAFAPLSVLASAARLAALDATRLVDDLLDVSRLSRGKLTLRRERLDLAGVTQAGIELARPAIEANRHDLQVDLQENDHIEIEGDADRLAQVISNLLSNAEKYTDAGGKIVLSASQPGGHAIVSICDNGIGIEAGLLANLFEPFLQSESLCDRSQGGIGLALVKSLVELHGGKVTAASDGPGCGSTFTFTIPLMQDRTLFGPRPAACDDPDSPRRLLLVDDHADSLESMAMLLEAHGHSVSCASDRAQAFALAAQIRPEACVLDIGLPDLDGDELMDRLRRLPQCANASFIALTGYGGPVERARSQTAGFVAHLVEPVEPARILRMIREATDPSGR